MARWSVYMMRSSCRRAASGQENTYDDNGECGDSRASQNHRLLRECNQVYFRYSRLSPASGPWQSIWQPTQPTSSSFRLMRAQPKMPLACSPLLHRGRQAFTSSLRIKRHFSETHRFADSPGVVRLKSGAVEFRFALRKWGGSCIVVGVDDRPLDAHDAFAVGPPLSILYRGVCLLVVAVVASIEAALGGDVAEYVLAAIAALLAVRSATERVRASDDGLVFRNLSRTYRFGWDEIESLDYSAQPFIWAGKWIGAKRHCVVVNPRHGRRVFIAATQSARGGLASERLLGEPPTLRYLTALNKFTSTSNPALGD